LRELSRHAPDDRLVLQALSDSWHAIGKIHWELHQVEETLNACRNAIEAQQRLFSFATTPQNCLLLGQRYMQLGRKLCELGRLDEAVECFSHRQALWSGDVGKHEEALRELRKWASQVGEDVNRLSPEERQKRQHYLDLCSRLESKGIANTLPTGVKP
jgi:hypothetical protein